jgi:hypothetical protein
MDRIFPDKIIFPSEIESYLSPVWRKPSLPALNNDDKI